MRRKPSLDHRESDRVSWRYVTMVAVGCFVFGYLGVLVWFAPCVLGSMFLIVAVMLGAPRADGARVLGVLVGSQLVGSSVAAVRGVESIWEPTFYELHWKILPAGRFAAISLVIGLVVLGARWLWWRYRGAA
ncbi:hypothetical protein [Rubrivirga sp. IMCC45206]|uniref:hypothetical protein n=1 Tax=Rubrivirga sp. IMCC45206 TaxID=3391614 RepID=UPI00399013B5